jgi:3-methyl-2-oxobutanoate hydroxymethyltransferase
MECVPEGLAKVVTEALTVPTIGIGAGVFCDGQVLVVNDMLGMFEKFTPKFVKKYTNLAALIREGITNYNDEVKAKSYPDPDHSFTTEIDYSDLLKS